MRVALAQINSMMANFSANKEKILDFARQAQEQNCDLVVFPELALFGYSPGDLLEREDLVVEQLKSLQELQKNRSLKIPALIGAITKAPKTPGKPFYNSAVLTGKKSKICHKHLLPNYDIFDESRFFRPGKISDNVITVGNKKILVFVCEDMWSAERADYIDPLKQLGKLKIDFVVSINSSPFSLGKKERRQKMAKIVAKKLKCPVLYVNMVGAQDEVIFDGGSFAINALGKVTHHARHFSEELLVIDLKDQKSKTRISASDEGEILRQALVLGIRDFAGKNNLKHIHLGLSGGIDSAVALCLAAEALGPKSVTAIALPGPFSAPESFTLAQVLAKNIGCEFHTASIDDIYKEQLASFEKVFGQQKFGLIHENLQARVRGGLLMMYSNFKNSLLLSTSNKSEIATGYATLYGDMCGGLAPLGDLLKNQVYAIAEAYNKEKELIPKAIVARAPSAELAPNQKDQDSLPPYDELDASVQRMVTEQEAAKKDIDRWLLKKIALSEFKRWQAPPILKISEHAFGRGRRWPISHGAYKK
jgi:NAD+ synthase (glutamine-hydrolysing)